MSYKTEFDKAGRVMRAIWETGETTVDERGIEFRKVKVLAVTHSPSRKCMSATFREAEFGQDGPFNVQKYGDMLDYVRVLTVPVSRYSEKNMRTVFDEAVRRVEADLLVA